MNGVRNIPVVNVQGKSLAETYESALIALYENGMKIETQYDKPGDPPSLDCTMNMTIDEPLADPMIHKAFPGGIEDLREYVMEVQGNKDHWVKNMDDPKDTRWEYTYSGRLTNYGQYKKNNEWVGNIKVNQVEYVIDKLAKQPFTRQAQMITWMPELDLDCYDPPCLQSIWYRLVKEEDVYFLNSNIRFRSNDSFGANFMNMFGFTMFNYEIIAKQLSEKMDAKVTLGRMNWHADSFHLYGKDIERAKQMLFDRLATTSFEDRVYNFQDELIREIYNEATSVIEKKITEQDKKYGG